MGKAISANKSFAFFIIVLLMPETHGIWYNLGRKKKEFSFWLSGLKTLLVPMRRIRV